MSANCDVEYRIATPADALCIGVLATQVFLDTYATEGIRPDLAREVLSVCSTEAITQSLSAQGTTFVLAEKEGHLVGFAELKGQRPCPIEGQAGQVEVVRLYVQRPFFRQGIGRELLRQSEALASICRATGIWLTAWAENDRALAFYRAQGYQDIGPIPYVFEDQTYENRLLVKSLPTMTGDPG